MSDNETTALTVSARAAVALGSAEHEVKLRELATASAGITTITNAAGYQQCHASRVALKRMRVEIEKTGKTAREDAAAFAKAVIAEEKRLIGIIAPEESRLATIQGEWDDRIAREKAAKEQAERERVAAIRARIDEIKRRPAAALRQDSAGVSALIAEIEAEAGSRTGGREAWLASFQEFEAEAAGALEAALEYLVELRDSKLASEAEAKRQTEAAAELARAQAEQARQEQEAREARERADAEALAARQEQDRLAREAREREETEARERLQREEAEAEERRQAQARADEEERKRVAAIREQIARFCAVATIEYPSLAAMEQAERDLEATVCFGTGFDEFAQEASAERDRWLLVLQQRINARRDEERRAREAAEAEARAQEERAAAEARAAEERDARMREVVLALDALRADPRVEEFARLATDYKLAPTGIESVEALAALCGCYADALGLLDKEAA